MFYFFELYPQIVPLFISNLQAYDLSHQGNTALLKQN
ncbi:Hypothetical protein AKI40_1441 [Enterobacter sp. FY-07]|nr:Hypothetical protein AKI40_1441 [Enterobacter sp. FY-07]